MLSRISGAMYDSSTSMSVRREVNVVWRQWSLQYVSRMRSSVSLGSRPSAVKYLTTSMRSSPFMASPASRQYAGACSGVISRNPARVSTGLA